MAINSHFIQMALLKKVFGSNKVYRHLLSDSSFQSRNFEDIGSQRGLFGSDEVKNKELERKMNASLESIIFNKIIDPAKDGEVILTYEDSILLRKYLLMTFARANLHNRKEGEIRDMFMSIIEDYTNREYGDRFEVSKYPVVNFFMYNSYIKFIEHKDIPMAWPENYFLAIPFDTQRTDYASVFAITDRQPGFMFRIDQTHSVMLTHRGMHDALLNSKGLNVTGVKTALPYAINAIEPDLWLMNKNSIIHPDGTETKAFKTAAIDPKDFLKTKIDHFNEIKSRDKKLFSYKYPIARMSDFDYEILVIDNMFKLLPYLKYGGYDIEVYLSKPESIIELLNKWLNIEQFVSANNPDDVTYWCSTKELKYQHIIWELMSKETIAYVNELINSMESKK